MPAISQTDLDNTLLRFAVHTRQLTGIPLRQSSSSQWPPQLASPPPHFTPILNTHTPIIINNTLNDRSRLWKEWQSTSYLISRMGGARYFPVALTPNGRADDLVSSLEEDDKIVFALPHEEQMNFQQLINALHPSPSSGKNIAYLQSQNSNLTTSASGEQEGPFQPLLEDLLHSSSTGTTKPYPAWAEEAIGKAPEATNIWIGTSKSRSSMHRDHYENLFLVVRGTKTFTVIPPTEAHFLSAEDTFYPLYQWTPSSPTSTTLKLEPLPSHPSTPWIPIDPLTTPTPPDRPTPHPQADARWTHFRSALDPLQITVHAGQMLYLPSGWYHAVEQTEDSPSNEGGGGGICLGLNWWWEAEVGERWAWLSLVRELGRKTAGVYEEDEEMV
ncbi:hypothetical protein CF327_g5880 [Tilletia walkeri]|nr:hypothetical protein CF327_g5880 [Tilletia walkeri]